MDFKYKKLKEFRKAAELTQQELADKIGVHRNSIIDYEKGLYEPSGYRMFRILIVFDKEMTDFYD